MTTKNELGPIKKRRYRFTADWRKSSAVKWLLMGLFVVLFYFNLAPHIIPETYNITENSRSEKDIKAPTLIRNEKATRAAEEQAVNAIEDIYSIVPIRNDLLVETIFLRIEGLNSDDQVSQQNKIDIYRTEIPTRYYDEYISNFIKSSSQNETYSEQLLEEMRRVTAEQKYTIPEETFYKLPKLSQEELSEMRIVAKDIVRKLTNEQIRDANIARTQVAELVNSSSLSNRTAREIVSEIARFAITPNKFFDRAATDEARDQARINTQPVVYKENDIIVKKGDLITPDIYAMLVEANLLQDKKHNWVKLGIVIASLLVTSFLYVFITQSQASQSIKGYNNSQLFMLFLITLLNLGVMQIFSLIQGEMSYIAGFLVPAALGAMLITLLIDEQLAMAFSFISTVAGSIILNSSNNGLFDFRFGFYIMVISLTAIYSIKHASQRSAILKAGIMVSLVGGLTVLTMFMMVEQLDRMPLIYSIAFAFGSGLLTSILVIGLMPFFEISFGILSALKLVELSSPNHPLLRKLLTETPGTYHHSVMVGNLAEAAAEAIGANGLLCRVGAFYHDIGKTKRPSYFIENQNNMENPHDTIDPMLSKSIIVAHAKDGAEMLKAYKIPKQLRDIAEQHHGTTSLKYFYFKAKKLAEEAGIEPDFTEDDFRYPGPKAQSKEAAVVGIADCIEAAVRSLRNPTVDQVEEMIHKIIKSRVDDNQYNECDLTMKELDKIAQSLKESLMGIFHSRIEYPEDTKAKENQKES